MTLPNPRGFVLESFPAYCTLLLYKHDQHDHVVGTILAYTTAGVLPHISPSFAKETFVGHLTKFLYVLSRELKSLAILSSVLSLCLSLRLRTRVCPIRFSWLPTLLYMVATILLLFLSPIFLVTIFQPAVARTPCPVHVS